MDIFVQQLINGLTLGSVYAVVALGYTMVYGIIQLINFAHGEVVMIGAMVALSVITALAGSGLPPMMVLVIAVMIAIPSCMLIAFAVEKIAYKPLRNAPRLSPLITAIGLSIILQTLAMWYWGRNYFPFPNLIEMSSFQIMGATISNVQIVIIFLSIAMMMGLLFLIHKTKLGVAMRATAQNQNVAGLMGIDANFVIAMAFVIGAGLGAVAGVMVGSYYGVIHYQMGFMLGLKAFTAAVLGGIGNIAGAMLGGLLLGIIQALGAGYIDVLTFGVFGSEHEEVIVFVVLILVLLVRPSGLLGERVGDRA